MRLPRKARFPLALEIALAVLLKLALLVLLWKAFFSAPQAPRMRMPAQQVEQHLLRAPPNSTSTQSELTHDSRR